MEEESKVKGPDDDTKEHILTDSPYVGGNKMSSSLRDRLKRSRMHSSPLSRPCSSSFTAPVAPRSIKFACTANDSVKEDTSLSSNPNFEPDIEERDPNIHQNLCSYSKDDIENTSDRKVLQTMYSNLKQVYAENEETLRKLKLVQKHHTKNNPEALSKLTSKWLYCAQECSKILYESMSEPRNISFKDFLTYCQVDFDMIKYDPENDTFIHL